MSNENKKRLVPVLIAVDLRPDDANLTSNNQKLLDKYNEIQDNGGRIVQTTNFGEGANGYLLIEYEI